jgi:predicted component of type VI protein secretion system
LERTKDKFTIGRDRGCDIAIADETVSTRHAELSFIADGKLLLTDCRSRNGTYRVLGDGSEVPVRQELVSPLDRVRFGNVRLAMRDLLESLRMKYPQFDHPGGAPPVPPARRPATGQAELERCECGRIKAVGQPCPGCGA